MAFSNPVTAFGIHQVTIEDRTTFDRFTALVLGDFGNENKEEQIPLQGGSSSFPWDTASGYADSKISLTFMQYDLNVLKYLGGYNSTTANYTEDADGDAAGAVSALVNKSGTSVFNATTGIASGAPKSSENPVFGNYLVKAVSATTVDVYLDNNLDGVAFVDDALKITSSPLTITASTGVDIPGANVTLTGGSGTIGMTTGDIAQFTVKPINTYNFEYKGGGAGTVKPEFKLTAFLEKLDTKYRVIEYPRVKANGISFNAKKKDWSSFESELMILNDTTAGYAFKFTAINR